MVGIQLSIHGGDVASSSANGDVTDPDVLAAARIVMDHITDRTGAVAKSSEVAK